MKSDVRVGCISSMFRTWALEVLGSELDTKENLVVQRAERST